MRADNEEAKEKKTHHDSQMNKEKKRKNQKIVNASQQPS